MRDREERVPAAGTGKLWGDSTYPQTWHCAVREGSKNLRMALVALGSEEDSHKRSHLDVDHYPP